MGRTSTTSTTSRTSSSRRSSTSSTSTRSSSPARSSTTAGFEGPRGGLGRDPRPLERYPADTRGRAGRRRWRRPAPRGRPARSAGGRCSAAKSRSAKAARIGAEQQVAGLDQAAADHAPPRGRDVDEVGQAERHPPRRSSSSTASASASPSRAAAVTCSPRTSSGSPPASSTSRRPRPAGRRLAGQAAEAAARGVALPAAPPAARARRAVGSTTMWPGSPAKPLAPRTQRAARPSARRRCRCRA